MGGFRARERRMPSARSNEIAMGTHRTGDIPITLHVTSNSWLVDSLRHPALFVSERTANVSGNRD